MSGSETNIKQNPAKGHVSLVPPIAARVLYQPASAGIIKCSGDPFNKPTNVFTLSVHRGNGTKSTIHPFSNPQTDKSS